ncbi:protein of unknown function [Clostridium beijerinckii]|nr:protein of unknown function [Clostridium beijerinckii]
MIIEIFEIVIDLINNFKIDIFIENQIIINFKQFFINILTYLIYSIISNRIAI